MNRPETGTFSILVPPGPVSPEGEFQPRVEALLKQIQELRSCTKRLQYENLRLDAEVEAREEKMLEWSNQLNQLKVQVAQQQTSVEQFKSETQRYQAQYEYAFQVTRSQEALLQRLTGENELLQRRLAAYRYQLADRGVRLLQKVPGLLWALRQLRKLRRRSGA
jgi:chromosome segregation ATPase